jgi:hypothetical protein
MSDNDLTNQALGDALGVSHAQVSRYRSGHRVPTDLVMLKIWRLTDWSVEEQIRAKYEQLAAVKAAGGDGQPDAPYAAGLRARLGTALQRIGLESGGDDE